MNVTVITTESGTAIPRNYGDLVLLTPHELGLKSLQVLRMRLLPGATTSRHYHPSEEVFFVLSGTVGCIAADAETSVVAGQAIVVQPNTPHQLVNRTTEAADVLIALSPPRDASSVVYL